MNEQEPFVKSPEAEAIAAFARERGITRLVHFTPLTNLFGIFAMGGIWARERIAAYARAEQDTDLLDYIAWNDEERYDARLDCVNLSVEHINAFLFDRFKAHFKDTDVWAILELDPACLEKEGVVFTTGNAASSYVKHHGSGSGADGLRRLYDETVTTGNAKGFRAETRDGLPPPYPTSVQAEVLFPGEIPLRMIRGLVFATGEDRSQAQSALEVLYGPSVAIPPCRVAPGDFGPRPSHL